MKHLIKNAVIVTVNKNRDILYDGALLIDGDKIAEVGVSAEVTARHPTADKITDAAGKVLFPGFVNTHTHLFQNLLKGLGDDMELKDWLSGMMFPASVHLQPEDTYHAAMLGCLEALRSGVTTTADYMHCHSKPGLSDGIAQAYKELGVRGILGRGSMDAGVEYGTSKDLVEPVGAVEKDLRRLFEKYHNTENGRIQVWAAPSSMWSNSREMLQMLWKVVQEYNSGFAVHISETDFARKATEWVHGVNDVDLLEELGILGPNVLMVHCCYVSEKDMALMKAHDMKVSHDVCSNMYLSDGVAPVPQMLKMGITCGLGVDGAASNNSQDMLELMKFTALQHKVHTLDPFSISAEKVLEMATIDGARALGLDGQVGSLEAGKKADIVIFDPKRSPKSVPMHNPVSTLVYSSSISNITGVLVDGRPILEDGTLMTADENAILENGQRAAEALCVRGSITNRLGGHPWNRLYDQASE